MELRPYIEEPTRRILPPSYVNVNHHPKIRHDFVLSKQEFVGAYWETLEYCYLTAGFAEPLSAFPGCSVPEVCNHCYTSLQYYLIVVTLYFWVTCYHFKWSYAFLPSQKMFLLIWMCNAVLFVSFVAFQFYPLYELISYFAAAVAVNCSMSMHDWVLHCCCLTLVDIRVLKPAFQVLDIFILNCDF